MIRELVGEDARNGITYWWDGRRQVLFQVDGRWCFGGFIPCDGTREGAVRAAEQAIRTSPRMSAWEKSYL